MAVLALVTALPDGLPAGAAGRAGGPLAPNEGVLFGAHVQAPPGADPFQVVADLEAKLGRRLAIEHSYRPWDTPFPDGREQRNVAEGRIPLISWGKTSTNEINAGQHDDLIRGRARGVRALGQPVLLRWFWEMGGNRNTAHAGSPNEYVAAWRRLRRLFADEGATNAAWVWCPDASDFATGRAQEFYPGDEEVDWTCADGYNFRHPARRSTTPRSFEDTFAAFYGWASERPRPIMVGEYGVVEDGPGDKAAWVAAAREALKTRFPAIAAVVYFHATRERDGFTYDWRMDSSDSSLQAFSAMGADPWFNPEVVRTLPDTTIDGGPEGVVASQEAAFSFSATEPGTGFECRLDAGGFEPCASPHLYGGLGQGPHSFEVRALGRDGRPDPTQARREWTVDTLGPEVVSIVPADGAAGVERGVRISAAFSEAMDASTLTASTFTLVVDGTNTAVAARVTYDASIRTAVLTPDMELLPLTTFRASLAGGTVADRAGNRMPAERTWRFTTAAPLPVPSPQG